MGRALGLVGLAALGCPADRPTPAPVPPLADPRPATPPHKETTKAPPETDAPPAASGRRAPLSPEAQAFYAGSLEGSWKINGYRIWRQGAYAAVAVGKEGPDETKESWLFRPDGTFRHILSKRLSFSGRYEIKEGWIATPADRTPDPFLLRTYDVSPSFLGPRRPQELFLGEFLHDGRDLALFYMGKALSPAALRQGHTFERAPHGAR